jgi:putative aldouronate transport system substrate-binding protein
MLSSGDLADLICNSDGAATEKLGRDGGLIPLNDLIKEYAPHIQKLIDTDLDYSSFAYSRDGNIYQVPKTQHFKTAEYSWIRKDWLDKLNLEIPTTVDELHDVLFAFRNNDPNGNGKKDEIPLFDREGWKMPDKVLYFWDSSLEFFPIDGRMTYEPMEPNFKTAVKNMKKWYEEGLIDPEIFTRGAKSRDILLGSNVGGFTKDWNSTAGYNVSLQEAIPGFELEAIPPVANQFGEIKERSTRTSAFGWGISSQCKDPVTVMKYMDYIFTDEGRRLTNFGIEGETYTLDASGNPVYTEAVMTSPLTPLGYLRSYGVGFRIGMDQDPNYEIAFYAQAAKDAANLYLSNYDNWYDPMEPSYKDGKLKIKYNADDEEEYLAIMNSVQPYVNEKFQSWILGISDFDKDYPKFIDEIKARGIDRAIEINQEAYDYYLKPSI